MLKCFTQYASKFGKLSSGLRIEKCIFIPIPKKANAKKIFKLPHNWTYHFQSNAQNFPSQTAVLELRTSKCFKLDVEKAEEPEIKLPTSIWIIEKAREFQKQNKTKHIDVCVIYYAKAFDCVDHNCGKFLKRWEFQTILSAF